jgi:transposase
MPKPSQTAGTTRTVSSNEVPTRAKRRTFSASDKRRILAAAAACKYGELGALLRTEGVYQSQLADWRKQLQQGGTALSKRRGPAPKLDSKDRLIAELQRDLSKAQREHGVLVAIIELQKKAQEMLHAMQQQGAP